MDELKILIGMVADLPQLAIWVLVAFYAYKVVVIGSVYGLLRFVIVHISKASDRRADNNRAVIDRDEIIKVAQMKTKFVNDSTAEMLDDLLAEVIKPGAHKYNYVHDHHIQQLRDAYRASNASAAA